MAGSRTEALMRCEALNDRRARALHSFPARARPAASIEHGECRHSPVHRVGPAWTPRSVAAQEDAAAYLMAETPPGARPGRRMLRAAVLFMAILLLSPVPSVFLT